MKKALILSLVALGASVFAEIAAPWGGSLSVKGNGKFVCRDAKMALQPGKSYRFDFKMSKVAPLSSKNIEHQLVLYAVDNGKHRAIKTFAAEVPVDGKTYQVSSAFTVPADAKGIIKLFAYNCFAQGSVNITDFKVAELGEAEKISVKSAPVIDEVKADPNTVLPALSNRQRALLEGNGRFFFLTEKVPLKNNQNYTISFEMRKVAPLSAKKIEHRIVLSHTDTNGKYSEFANFGDDVPVDGKWHKVTGTFKTPSADGSCTIYIYNCNADGSMEVKNIRMTLGNSAVPAPAPVKTAAPAPKMQQAPDFEVAGNGKFKGGHFHVQVKSASTCEFNFKMMKTPEMSKNSAEQRVVIAVITKSGKIREAGYIGEKLPADSKWHDMKYTFKVPPESNGTLRIYVYNCNATGKISLKDFKYICR